MELVPPADASDPRCSSALHLVCPMMQLRCSWMSDFVQLSENDLRWELNTIRESQCPAPCYREKTIIPSQVLQPSRSQSAWISSMSIGSPCCAASVSGRELLEACDPETERAGAGRAGRAWVGAPSLLLERHPGCSGPQVCSPGDGPIFPILYIASACFSARCFIAWVTKVLIKYSRNR